MSSPLKKLASGYEAEVDAVGKDEWSRHLQNFNDANIYQTWSYGSVRWGEQNLSHIILKKNGAVVSMVQARIVTLPVVNKGIAYIAWGPLWQLKDTGPDVENIRQILRALRNEYVIRRGYFLRMRPNLTEPEGRPVLQVFEEEQFSWQRSHYRTILIDLTQSADDLRKNLHRTWRQKLKSADKKNITVMEGVDDDLYQALLIPYNKMIARKQFVPGLDAEEFRIIQQDLPESLKMKIFVAEYQGEPIGSLLASFMGTKGIFILGGNNELGLKLGVSHLLPWRMILWMKQAGAHWCDLGGYNPDKNPGTARFKAGISGIDLRHAGQFEASAGFMNSLLVSAADFLKTITDRFNISLDRKQPSPSGHEKKTSKTPSQNVFHTLEERGFIQQVTVRDDIIRLLARPLTCYIGFDPTAKSLHVGSLVPIMALAHLQNSGHRIIVVIGGCTALVGDPSGKIEARPIMSRDEINRNAESIKKQLSRFIKFDKQKAIMVNNADWLRDLSYLDFLRKIGSHFSVNSMLAAESYRSRLEKGLNFIEFNYMLLQAYDFWHLYKHYNCRLQLGGNDQWGNILAGIDLTRRMEKAVVYGITFPLLTTSSGLKMGKTNTGAVWLNPTMTTPFDYYKYWINQDDSDIGRFLSLFTFLPAKKINELVSAQGSDIRVAKDVLAFEATKLCHSETEAVKARDAARQLLDKSRAAESDAVS